jgi:hypothetical protein
MPSATLGHDASLSFVVRGRGRLVIRKLVKEDRNFPVGAAFPVLSLSKGNRDLDYDFNYLTN